MRRHIINIGIALTIVCSIVGRIMADEQELVTGYHSIDKLAEVIDSAKSKIYVVGYKLTSEKAFDSLLSARKRGIDIKLVFDGEESKSKKSLVRMAVRENFNVRIWDTEINGKLHAKMYIIDDKILIIGSFNLSESAEKSNYELVLITQQSDLLEEAQKEWDKIWRNANPN